MAATLGAMSCCSVSSAKAIALNGLCHKVGKRSRHLLVECAAAVYAANRTGHVPANHPAFGAQLKSLRVVRAV
jgi:hypothetical protein